LQPLKNSLFHIKEESLIEIIFSVWMTLETLLTLTMERESAKTETEGRNHKHEA